jgi:predicted RNase H-like HicB family nuclease
MRYTVVIEPTREPDDPGWYYVHIPALDLTTHGDGVEGAMAAARELAEAWIAERRAHGESVPVEEAGFVSQIEIGEDAVHSA